MVKEKVVDKKIKEHKDKYIHIPYRWIDNIYCFLSWAFITMVSTGVLVGMNMIVILIISTYVDIYTFVSAIAVITSAILSFILMYFLINEKGDVKQNKHK